MRQKFAEILDILMGFRKFLAWSTLLLVGIIFRITNKVDGGQFVDLMKTVTISFFGANSVEHFSTMVKAHLDSKVAILTAQKGGDSDAS